jgi:hypothetical protein
MCACKQFNLELRVIDASSFDHLWTLNGFAAVEANWRLAPKANRLSAALHESVTRIFTRRRVRDARFHSPRTALPVHHSLQR